MFVLCKFKEGFIEVFVVIDVVVCGFDILGVMYVYNFDIL